MGIDAFDEGGQFKRRVKVYEEMKVADRADLKRPVRVDGVRLRACSDMRCLCNDAEGDVLCGGVVSSVVEYCKVYDNE